MTGGSSDSSEKRRSDDLFAVGSQFSGEWTDPHQSHSDDEEDDFTGLDILNGEAFMSKFEQDVSENPWRHPYQEREDADGSIGSVVVEGVGGKSTVFSDTCVGAQNGESSRDGALRYQKPLTTPNSTSRASKTTPTPTTPTSSSQNPTHPPSTEVYIKAFFIEHSIILAIILLVIVPITAGLVAGIRKKCLAMGIGVAVAFFVPIAALFTLFQVLWRREERMKAKEKEKLQAAATEEARKTSVDPAFMV